MKINKFTIEQSNKT